MKPVIAVAGPTASGKTALAIELALRGDAEVISADSMQFYRGMEIGSGAPSLEEQARVPHHFIGFLNPNEPYSAGAFEMAARSCIAELAERGKNAVVAGGSGLYLRALIDGLFTGPSKDDALRARLHQEAADTGVDALYVRLENTDPEYARVIQPNDLRRIVRALEVFERTGIPLSRLHQEHQASLEPLEVLQVGLEWPREALYARINQRVDAMLAAGFVAEVQCLLDQGYAGDIERLRALGYREIAAHLRGETSLDEAVELMKRNTRRYAKRQLSWFRGDLRIQWYSAEHRSAEELAETILADLRS